MEVRIRENEEGFYAESGDEFQTFHQCPTRESVELAKADALFAYSTGEEEWEGRDEDDARDIIAVAGR